MWQSSIRFLTTKTSVSLVIPRFPLRFIIQYQLQSKSSEMNGAFVRLWILYASETDGGRIVWVYSDTSNLGVVSSSVSQESNRSHIYFLPSHLFILHDRQKAKGICSQSVLYIKCRVVWHTILHILHQIAENIWTSKNAFVTSQGSLMKTTEAKNVI